MLEAMVQTRAMPEGIKVWYHLFRALQFQGFSGSSGPVQSSIRGVLRSCSFSWRSGGVESALDWGTWCPDSTSSSSEDFLELFDEADDMAYKGNTIWAKRG